MAGEDPNGWERPSPSGGSGALRKAAGGRPPWEHARGPRRFEAQYPSEQAKAEQAAEDYAANQADAASYEMDEREEW